MGRIKTNWDGSKGKKKMNRKGLFKKTGSDSPPKPKNWSKMSAAQKAEWRQFHHAQAIEGVEKGDPKFTRYKTETVSGKKKGAIKKTNQDGGSYSAKHPGAPADQLKRNQAILGKRGDTRITKSNAGAAIRDDKAHMDYLKRDVNDIQHSHMSQSKKDRWETADEKHISKLAGDVKADHHIVNRIAGRNSRR